MFFIPASLSKNLDANFEFKRIRVNYKKKL